MKEGSFMKRIKLPVKAISLLSAVCTAMSVGSALSASAAGLPEFCRMGDLNADGKVDLRDARGALAAYVDDFIGIQDSTVNAGNFTGDINMNGKIDLSDASNILRYYTYTMVGEQPLWADLRKVNSVKGGLAPDYTGTPAARPDNSSFVIDSVSGAVYRPFALSGLYVEIGCAEGRPGETVEIPIYISCADGLAGFMLDINAGDLKVNSFSSPLDPALTAFNPAMCDKDYTCSCLVWSSEDGLDRTFETGSLAGTISYCIPEDAAPGTVYPIQMDSKLPDDLEFGDKVSAEMYYQSRVSEFVSSKPDTDIQNIAFTELDGVVIVK